MSTDTIEKNKEVILNYGLIAYGQLKDIEALQKELETTFVGKIRILFQTVTAKRLHIKKGENSEGNYEYVVRMEGDR